MVGISGSLGLVVLQLLGGVTWLLLNRSIERYWSLCSICDLGTKINRGGYFLAIRTEATLRVGFKLWDVLSVS